MKLPDLAPLRRWWAAHDGLDGAVRTLGAAAVVVTIEVLAGYFLWRGVTESVRIPEALGWALQFGLTGGSVVGTRAFHRGASEDKWWGLATSATAVVFVVADASIAALQLSGLIAWHSGVLAVGVLVQCLVVGYLTVHTLMARPRAVAQPARVEPWGGPDTVTAPTPPQAPTHPSTPREPTPLRSVSTPRRTSRTPRSDTVHVEGWESWMAAVSRDDYRDDTRWLRARAKAVGVKQRDRTNSEICPDVETAELARAREAVSA